MLIAIDDCIPLGGKCWRRFKLKLKCKQHAHLHHTLLIQNYFWYSTMVRWNVSICFECILGRWFIVALPKVEMIERGYSVGNENETEEKVVIFTHNFKKFQKLYKYSKVLSPFKVRLIGCISDSGRICTLFAPKSKLVVQSLTINIATCVPDFFRYKLRLKIQNIPHPGLIFSSFLHTYIVCTILVHFKSTPRSGKKSDPSKLALF